eukprot:TRINITY_DN26161_c0_g1_i1.p1 TRINITY_DN26161_c0_g1~~TRINITY_DN26161_c0_g1_i1.p1  ORF type:complete len:567 (+),score=63.89 TRINITY_DN26161_c0_g1_i1:67-1767(+)
MTTCAILLVASLSFVSAKPSSSSPYDPETHVAKGSRGCGSESPYRRGTTSVATGTYAGVEWTYRIYVPTSYKKNTPMPLILQHPGWGMTASSEEAGAGITGYAESKGFISVTPQGGNDNRHAGGPWYSWNAVGTTQSPGAAGATCTSEANFPSYCYKSCSPCTDKPQCHWTTCHETVTPTGTGRTDTGGFIPSLYNTLESQLCIDTTREYAAGESNGGMMTYQLGVDLASRLAAIVPQFGSFHKGYAMAPLVGVPVMDIHGTSDTTVPANVSLSGDGYYYTTTHEIFNGGAYSTGWKKANGCTGTPSHYKTNYDGIQSLWCVLEGECPGGDVVRCSYNAGHNWFHNGGEDNGGLVTDFLLKFTKLSHIGFGLSDGDQFEEKLPAPGDVLTDIRVIAGGAVDDPSLAPEPVWPEQTLKSESKGHYGNPSTGCLQDEDAVPAGTGHTCAPKIGVSVNNSALPTPHCKLGGVSPSANGCPMDAHVSQSSMAWPICLAKGISGDPYSNGEFHCLLVCPCEAGKIGSSGECGSHSHSHCPSGARCERGDLRKRDQGVCTYSIHKDGDSLVV